MPQPTNSDTETPETHCENGHIHTYSHRLTRFNVTRSYMGINRLLSNNLDIPTIYSNKPDRAKFKCTYHKSSAEPFTITLPVPNAHDGSSMSFSFSICQQVETHASSTVVV